MSPKAGVSPRWGHVDFMLKLPGTSCVSLVTMKWGSLDKKCARFKAWGFVGNKDINQQDFFVTDNQNYQSNHTRLHLNSLLERTGSVRKLYINLWNKDTGGYSQALVPGHTLRRHLSHKHTHVPAATRHWRHGNTYFISGKARRTNGNIPDEIFGSVTRLRVKYPTSTSLYLLC